MWGKPVSGDSTKAFCTLCHWEFSINHGGENNLTYTSTGMQKKAKLAKGASNIDAICVMSTADNDKTVASEALHVCHTVKHGLSYNSTDCLVRRFSSVCFMT